MRLLRYSQSRSFKAAQGVIFLTEFARAVILDSLGTIRGRNQVISHGIAERFHKPPVLQRPIAAFSKSNPFRMLYVSTVDVYKHQWNVAEAVARLRQEGMPVEISFVGTAYPPAMERLRRVLSKVDPAGEFIHYHGASSFLQVHSVYHKADAFVFASTCENMPIVLLEAMASGLPIACSNRAPMTDILGDAGLYLDPLDPVDIQRALETILTSPGLREKYANRAYERARTYCWEKCASATFAFIQTVAAGAREMKAN